MYGSSGTGGASPSCPITRSSAGRPAAVWSPSDVPGTDTLWTVEAGETLTPEARSPCAGTARRA